eukprot:comp19165_c0_seq1/m.21851 comp19165_c0_seq1/g.21851  ORF comp19165_c0_seq1/g.21851 comp19165_c0_seq1/m.21851 type:complete len:135 (-) comp19165_c0_seq1:57-461(-)
MLQDNEEDAPAVPVADVETHAQLHPQATAPQVEGTEGSGRTERTEEGLSEEEQKAILINQVLELQNTLDELSQRVNRVKDENSKLKSENQLLTQYIENLMASSNVVQGAKDSSSTTGRKSSLQSLWSSLGGGKK